MNQKKTAGRRFFLLFLPLFLLLLFLLFPFYWTFVTSIKPESELYGAAVTYWPRDVTMESYRNLFLKFNF